MRLIRDQYNTRDIIFKNDDYKATVAADPAAQPPSARLVSHPCTQQVSSAKTVSNLPLWLQPRSIELRVYEKRRMITSQPQESERASMQSEEPTKVALETTKREVTCLVSPTRTSPNLGG